MCTWLSLRACWERRGISPQTLWNPDRYSVAAAPPAPGVSTRAFLMHTSPKLMRYHAESTPSSTPSCFSSGLEEPCVSSQAVIPGVWGLGGAVWGSSALVSTSLKDFPLSQPVITKNKNTNVDPSITVYTTSLHSFSKKSTIPFAAALEHRTPQSRELWSTLNTASRNPGVFLGLECVCVCECVHALCRVVMC